MRTSFSDDARVTFAALADVLVPACGAFPSASEAGVAGENLDRALTARPDRVDALARLLESVRGKDPRETVRTLERTDRAAFVMLIEAVTGAYILDRAVQDALGYHGQQPKEIDTGAPDHVDLLPAVVARGPLYRPTPVQETSLHTNGSGPAGPPRGD